MHEPPISRGMGGFGPAGLNCSSCHGAENFDYPNGTGSVPGDEIWFMPPLEMAWLGKTPQEICLQLKDPERNGARTLQQLIEHNATDGLVGWGWHPGRGRENPPGNQALFGELTQAWVDSGAYCPSE